MASMTLLAMTQNILQAMGSDQVDTIAATPESAQVAQIIQDVFFKIVNERDWPHYHELDQLTGLADLTQPAKMQIPTSVSRVLWNKYDVRVSVGNPKLLRNMTYLSPSEFIDKVSGRNQNDANVTEYTDSGSNAVLNIITDRGPQFWTSFDDQFIWFDAYDSGVDTALQETKSVIHVVKEPGWTASDGSVPDLPDHMFPLLLSQSKVECFSKIKQMSEQLEERDTKRQRVTLQHRAWREDGDNTGVNYGRK